MSATFAVRLSGLLARRKIKPPFAAELLGVSTELVLSWINGSDSPNRFEAVGILAEIVAVDIRSNRASQNINWAGADWSKPTSVLAVTFNCSKTCVSMARARHAPETLDAANTFRSNRVADWRTVDWSMSNVELAEKYHVSHETVRTQRLKHAPGTYTGRTLANCATDWSEIDWSRPVDKIATELGVHKNSVYRQKRKYKPS